MSERTRADVAPEGRWPGTSQIRRALLQFRKAVRRGTIVHGMKDREALRWDDVRVFLAIRRQKTLAGAARDLCVDQTTVGRRLASLEASLDARLFDRTPEGLTLTPAGEAVVDAAVHIEESMLA